MKESKIKAFDFATDLTKQLITLATILIGLSITFFEKFKINFSKDILLSGWILLFLSVIFGIITLMAITGTLNDICNKGKNKENSIYSKNIRIPSILQVITFLTGLLLIIINSFFIEVKEIDSEKIYLIKKPNCKTPDITISDSLKLKTENKKIISEKTELEKSKH